MTEKQITALKNGLPPYKKQSDEQRLLARELCCREMINSIMIYGDINSPYNEKTGEFDYYLHSYIDGNEYSHLGKERVLELVREQQEDFKHTKVRRSVYTDCEGCTYNSCTWADD
jgi:hypothetical protein